VPFGIAVVVVVVVGWKGVGEFIFMIVFI